MQHHTHAPPGASGGHTALERLLEADWSKGVPKGYAAALDRLRQLRGEYEEIIAKAIDDLDTLDAVTADLEPEEDADFDDMGGEPSLAAPEAVTCPEGPAAAVRKPRERSAKLQTDRVDPTCDQSDWPRGGGFSQGADGELDTADDEPSLGAIERHPMSSVLHGVTVDYRNGQEHWAADAFGRPVASDDREDDAGDNPEEENEHGADDDRGEETLGWPERLSQKSLGKNSEDGEWSLGSTSAIDQRRWSEGRGDDREEEHDGREDANEDHDGYCDAEGDAGDILGSGCNDGTRPPSFIDASKPNLGRPFADPKRFPQRYAMIVEGNCLSPAVPDGMRLEFVKGSLILMRDLVAIFIDPAKVKAGGHQVVVKRFVGHGRCALGEGMMVEFDHPTLTRYVIPNDHILDVHRCVAMVKDDMPRVRLPVEQTAFSNV